MPYMENQEYVILKSVKVFIQNKTLNLDDRKLKSLDEVKGLKSLNNLETLSLCHNQLKALPEWIGKISSLKALFLSTRLFRRVNKS